MSQTRALGGPTKVTLGHPWEARAQGLAGEVGGLCRYPCSHGGHGHAEGETAGSEVPRSWF